MSAASPGLVDQLAGVRLLCVGDVMIDRFVRGGVERISPESPVPVLRAGGQDVVAGGAGNVARNATALGARASVVGVVGADAAAEELRAALAGVVGVEAVCVTAPGRPTTVKTRYVSSGQHLLRVDVEDATAIDEPVQRAVLAAVIERLGDHDVVVLSDYAKGVLTDAVITTVIAAARAAGVPVVVDPKRADLSVYAGASVITPNAAETRAATGVSVVDDAGAERAGARVLAAVGGGSVLITRGEQGMSLIGADGSARHVGARSREVYDVVGAGDTVIAALALCLAAGAPLPAAMDVANAAAGIAVSKHGTATVSPGELRAALAAEAATAGVGVFDRLEDLLHHVAGATAGLRVGFTNGVFDLVHPGHVAILAAARSACDYLVVGVNSDASVRRLKGPGRPVNPTHARASVLAALRPVDAVVVFDQDTPLDVITALRPDVLVKGADYARADVVGADVVESYGGKVVLIDLVPGVSSTRIIARIGAGTSSPG